jgi:hypothetical protein
MATTESKPAASDRNPGLARPATRVDPRVPPPAVLDLVQSAALVGGAGQPPTRSSTTTSRRPPVLRLGRLIQIPSQPLLELLAGTTLEVAQPATLSCRRAAKRVRGNTII